MTQRSTTTLSELQTLIDFRTKPLNAAERQHVMDGLKTFITGREKRRRGPRTKPQMA